MANNGHHLDTGPAEQKQMGTTTEGGDHLDEHNDVDEPKIGIDTSNTGKQNSGKDAPCMQ